MRRSKSKRQLIAVLLAALTMAVLGALVYGQGESTSHLTYHGNLARTGWNNREMALTYASIDNRPEIGRGRFGKIWETRLIHEGVFEQVYAQPLYHEGIVYAVTQRNWVSALHAADGVRIWERQVARPLSQEQWEAKIGSTCGDVNPWHGITSTPVLDPATNILYVVAVTLDQDDFQQYRMYALDIGNKGATRPGWPTDGVLLDGIYRSPSFTMDFDAYRATQRGGLTLLDGVVYAPFSSRCDVFAWSGFVFGVDTANPGGELRVFSAAPDGTGTGAGIWGGAGISVDQDGYMYVATGNGTFNATNAMPPNSSFAQSILRLDPRDPPLYFVKDPANYYTIPNFTPTNNRDEDMGGSSITVIPDQSDTGTTTPRLLLTSAKDGVVYLVNRDYLGGMVAPNGAQIQRLKTFRGGGSGGAKVAAAYFDAGPDGRFVYLSAGHSDQPFTGNYAHWGDANINMSPAASLARAEIGTSPSLAIFGERVFAAWVTNDGSRSVRIKASDNGRNWNPPSAPVGVTVGPRSSPALAAWGSTLALAWIQTETRDVRVIYSLDGLSWPATGFPIGARAVRDTSPAVTVYNGLLYVSWVNDSPGREVMIKSSLDGMNWSPAVSTGESSDHLGGVAPLGVLNDRLHVFWVTTDPGPPITTRRLFYKSSPDGLDWSSPRASTGERVNIESQIAAAPYHDLTFLPRLHFFWLVNRANNRQVQNSSIGLDLVTGVFGQEPRLTDCNETGFGSSGPTAVAWGTNLHMAFVANNPNRDLLGKIAQPAYPGRGVVAFRLVAEKGGPSQLVPAWGSPFTMSYNPSSPVVTSDGLSDPIAWVVDPTPSSTGSKPIVYGFNALTGEVLYNSERTSGMADRPTWNGRKFGTPAVVAGKLFLGTEQGIVAYGLPPE